MMLTYTGDIVQSPKKQQTTRRRSCNNQQNSEKYNINMSKKCSCNLRKNRQEQCYI